ncbi:MAG: hypothetical protein J2P54_05050 [Bradyrhizobiaceae bacterium]|nr:hypothetical protein [Bradyrhizobiaceae bacterium]
MADAITSMTVWARITDYLFGRNTLIGIASVILLMISGYATWSGMHDFIIGVSSQTRPAREMPGIFVTSDFFVVVIVAVLTFMMWLALRETFRAGPEFRHRLITLPLYLFLALWSIGFGYGFWWSLIAGEEATRTSLATLQEEARDAANAIASRLDAVRAQLDNVAAWSDSQMTREETSGGSCGTPSGAGRGPLYNARQSVKDQVNSLRDGITRNWLEPVQADITQLRQIANSPEDGTFLERQRRFESQVADVRGLARKIASRSNEFGVSNANEMRALADALSIEPNKAAFSCYDPTLAQRLREAANQAAQSAELHLPEASFSEGPAGVANAIKRLWTNIGAYSISLVHFIRSGGSDTVHQTASGEPITGRDVIALLATVGVDFGILAMTLLNPPGYNPGRLPRDALARAHQRLHLPNAEVAQHLTEAIQTAVARAPGDDADFEWIRKHFIHHNGASYFVIPNLYSVEQNDKNKEEELRALAMNQLAGVLDDLKVVRALTPRELRRLGREELRDSFSDLTPFREERMALASGQPVKDDGLLGRVFAKPPKAPASEDGSKHVRNHGLLSKAARALDIAGWSDKAQKDVEVFRLVDSEGLTPLLAVLNRVRLREAET